MFQVQLANQIYDLVDRHLRKLDQELSKFKMELEADNAGITEILEQRSLELDSAAPPRISGFVRFMFLLLLYSGRAFIYYFLD